MWELIAAFSFFASYNMQGVSGLQLQEPRDCNPLAKSSTEILPRMANLAQFDAFLIDSEESYYYPANAAQYNLSQTCCPNNSYIVEWEVVLKTFQAPAPFNDGRLRSLNGTVLPEPFPLQINEGYIDYSNWLYQGSVTWDDIQGVALTTLHNKTLLGSLQAKCGVANGTIVAVLPKIGGNLTSDCLNAPGLKVLESQPIRVINSSLPTGVFTNFFIDSSFKLPKNLTDRSGSTFLSLSRLQDSPYQDFMGLMKLLNFSATSSPSTIDVASLNWSNTSVGIGVSSFGRVESHVLLDDGAAATGFTGLAGCFGPMEIQVFTENLYFDNAKVPVLVPDAPGSYGGCSFNASDELTYTVIGIPTEKKTLEVNRFRNKPLVCCPDGEYVRKLDLQFRGDSDFSNPDYDGVYRKRQWGFTGICSGGTRLPEVSAGNGCTGEGALLDAFNSTVQIDYDNREDGQRTRIGYGRDSGGILGLLGEGPNSTLKDTAGEYLGGYSGLYNNNPAKGKRLRVVGLDATASCSGISSIGMILRTKDQVNEPGTLSPGAIAGIVIGVVAFIAIIALAGVLITKRRRNARRISNDSDKASMIRAPAA